MIWNPYNIYRAFKAGRRPFIVYRKGYWTLIFAPSEENLRTKFHNSRNSRRLYGSWKYIKLIA